MSKTTLTLRALNRATLARQLLLEPSNMPTLAAIEQLVGLQAQVPNPPYIGLWTRLATFRREELTHLMEEHLVVRATLMRSTLHLFTAQDYLLLRLALQPALTRALSAFFGQRAKGLDIERIVAAARPFVEERPRTFTELRTMLTTLEPGRDPEALAYVVRTHLPLVQVPPGGSWGFGGSPAHTLAETWLGKPLNASDTGLRTLVHRYLAAFGPATVKDIQTWSGLVKLQDAIAKLKPELRTYQDEQGNELLDLPDLTLPSEDMPAPPRFLPEYDNLILSHADRSRVIPEKYKSNVFLSAGRVRATFLLNGFVAGTWKVERASGTARLIIEPFEPLAHQEQDAPVAEAERLIRFIEDTASTYEVQISL